jgi:pyruvate/2-oxoacid:ferredoxin oxidoreductase beta subunit
VSHEARSDAGAHPHELGLAPAADSAQGRGCGQNTAAVHEPLPETLELLGANGHLMSGGHLACRGCGGALALRMALDALGSDCVFTIPASCMAVIDGPFPLSALHVPLLHMAFEAAAPAAAGIKAGLVAQGNEHTLVVAWAGDGATFDIGFGAVSASAARNDDFLYVCYDNEAYMNTGVQQSGATPPAAWTTTSPRLALKITPKKDIVSILAAHRVPYVATASPSHPDDLVAKFRRARSRRGFRFIHIFTPCPPGQQFDESLTVRIARQAVTSRVFPLLEIEDGERLALQSVLEPSSVRDYLEMQGRFRHMQAEDAAAFEREVQRRWAALENWQARAPLYPLQDEPARGERAGG